MNAMHTTTAADSHTEVLTDGVWEHCGDGSGSCPLPDAEGRAAVLRAAVSGYIREWEGYTVREAGDPAPRYRIVWIDDAGDVLAVADTDDLDDDDRAEVLAAVADWRGS